jgi:hypothetical protein
LVADLLLCCPAATRRAHQDYLVRLGALEVAVRRLGAGGRGGGAAATLVGSLVKDRPQDVAVAAVAAGALPALLALLGEADDPTAAAAVAALFALVERGDAIAAAAVDEGAVCALGELLGRAGLSTAPASLRLALRALNWLARTAAGAKRLVTDGALPHVVGLLRSPVGGVAGDAITCLEGASAASSWGAVADELLADATAAPAIAALVLARDGDTPFRAANAIAMTMTWALEYSGCPEAARRAGGLAAAARRAGAVPRLLELYRAALEDEQRRSCAANMMCALAFVCHLDVAAAREAFGAGAWREACRIVLEEDARADRADGELVALSLSLLADLIPHCRGGAPRSAAAAEPGLAAAVARALGRAAAREPPSTRAASLAQAARMASKAVAVLEEALEGSDDGAHRAAEFIHAGGVGHLVRASPHWGRWGPGGGAPWGM